MFDCMGKPLTVAGERDEELVDMFKVYENLLNLICESIAPIAIKIEALETIAMSKISHRFHNIQIPDAKLQDLDKVLIKTLRKIFDLTQSTTVRSMF